MEKVTINNDRAYRMAKAMIAEFGEDNFNLAQGTADIIGAAEKAITYLNDGFCKLAGVESVLKTPEDTMWHMVDILMQSIEPREEMPVQLKWYITHYEQYSRAGWELTKKILDRLREIGGKQAYDALTEDKVFQRTRTELREREEQLKARLRYDKLESIETGEWSNLTEGGEEQ